MKNECHLNSFILSFAVPMVIKAPKDRCLKVTERVERLVL